MKKKVGNFTGNVSGQYPCWCSIDDGNGNSIAFDHRCLSDIEYLVSQMKKSAIDNLGENNKHEAE